MNQSAQILDVLNQGVRDLQWFHQNKRQLQEKYNEQFIAINNQQILTSCKTLPEMITQLRKMKQDPADVLIEYVSKMIIIF